MLTMFLVLLNSFSCIAMIVVTLFVLFGYELKDRKWPFAVSLGVLTVLLILSSLFIDNIETVETISDLLQSLSAMFLPYFLFKVRKARTFALFGFVMPSFTDVINTLINSFIKRISFYGLLIENIIIFTVITLLIIILNKLFNVKSEPEFLETIPIAIYIIIFVYILADFYSIEMKKDSSFYSEVSDVLQFVSTSAIIIAVSWMIFRYISESALKREAEKQRDAEIHHFEEMVKKNRDIRTFRHDYKNNLFSISSFINSGKIEEAQNYITNLFGELKTTENRFVTGNYLADAILSEKADIAFATDTKIEFDGTIPADWISNNDLCTILSNALDNAVRACENISNAVIHIESKETPNSVSIKIRNPVTIIVEIKNNRILTTKADKENHGIGLSNIERTAKKYHGNLKLECTEYEFVMKIGLLKMN